MNDVGLHLLAGLRRLHTLLEDRSPLGFGKKVQPVYIFIKRALESLWYSRDRAVGENIPISARDLTGYLSGVWRFYS